MQNELDKICILHSGSHRSIGCSGILPLDNQLPDCRGFDKLYLAAAGELFGKQTHPALV